MLDGIFEVNPREGLNARRDARRALEAARRNRIATHWADVVGADVPRIGGNDLHACFSRFYAELTVPRAQTDTRRLFDAFAPLFRERLEHLRREDRAVRERVSKGDYPGASAEIRTRIWTEGDAMLGALGELVHADERTELRLRGCSALGIPEPLERLRLGWGRLLGDDLESRPHEAPAFEPFAWVYATLTRERSRDELRKLYSTMREAYDPENAARAYEAIKSQMNSEEWRLLRYHPTDGDVPLSE
ncbi:MAG: hypothetical protein K8T90_02885 [Planctomycetes bacterium]|nr:hypothetical protein [Planctomycetota bacterium]